MLLNIEYKIDFEELFSNFIRKILLKMSATPVDINETKFQIYRDLQIIQVISRSSQDNKNQSVNFKSFNKGCMRGLVMDYLFKIPYVPKQELYRQVVSIVELNTPSHALTLVQRVLDGTITIVNAENFKYMGTSYTFDFPTSDSIDRWLIFYENLAAQTNQFGSSSAKLKIFQSLGVFSHRIAPNERDDTTENYFGRVYNDGVKVVKGNNGNFFVKPDTFFCLVYPRRNGSGLASITRDDHALHIVERDASKVALAVAQLIFNYVISDVIVNDKFSEDGKLTRYIQFVFGKKIFSTITRSYISEVGMTFSVDQSFQDVLDMVANLQNPVPPEPAKPHNIRFGIHFERSGIFEIIRLENEDIMWYDQDSDHWFENTDRAYFRTKCIIDTTKFDHDPWVVAAARFSKMYDPAKSYIILANCDEKDLSHPAVTLYREMTNLQ